MVNADELPSGFGVDQFLTLVNKCTHFVLNGICCLSPKVLKVKSWGFVNSSVWRLLKKPSPTVFPIFLFNWSWKSLLKPPFKDSFV